MNTEIRPPLRIISFDELEPSKGIRLGKVSLWRLERDGKFPKRIRIGLKSYGWLETEIDGWIAERIAARDTAGSAAQTEQAAA